MIHMPVWAGSSSSRSGRPSSWFSSRILTRAVISVACRRSSRSCWGTPRSLSTTRAMSSAESAMPSMLTAIDSTPASWSASSGVRVASMHTLRSSTSSSSMRVSRRNTSRASAVSSKNTAAYAKSTMSSAASFAPTSMSLTVRCGALLFCLRGLTSLPPAERPPRQQGTVSRESPSPMSPRVSRGCRDLDQDDRSRWPPWWRRPRGWWCRPSPRAV
jgi:hypothetical protein